MNGLFYKMGGLRVFYFVIFLLLFTFCIFCSNVVFCETLDDLPVTIEFKDLHLTENLVKAIQSLNGLAGVYCIKNLTTGAMYIGSSIFLADRIRSHILNSTNIHLRNAIKMYGLQDFSVIIVEYVEP